MQRGGWQRAWEGVGETSETQPYLILIRLSRPRIAVLRLAARSCGTQPLRAGAVATAAVEARHSRTQLRKSCMAAHAEAAPRAVAPLWQLAAAAPGRGMQRGGWCCAPFALRRRRSSKSYSVTRQQQLQLWQGTLQLVQGGSGPRQPAALHHDADAMADVRTPSA